VSANEADGALVVSVVMFVLGSAYLANVGNVPARIYKYSIDWWSRRRPISYWPFSTYWPGLIPFWVWRLAIGLWFCGCSIALAIAAGRSL
jgi:hypothetical protein